MQPNEVADKIDCASLSERAAYAMPPRIAVLVISDVRVVREGIAQSLDQDQALLVVATAPPEQAGPAIARFQPDVALLDMRAATALETVRILRSTHSALEIVALGVAESEQALLACAQAGISGLIPPNASASDVSKAVQSAMRGELICTPRIAGILLSRLRMMGSMPAEQSGGDALTQREHEIALLIGEGLSNKQIAFALGIQNATVKNHVHNVLGKMRLSRRSQVSARLRNVAVLDLDAFRHPAASFPAEQAARARA